MIVKNIPLTAAEIPCPVHILPEQAVFFDIETTGLSRRTSHLYMIGAILCDHGQFRLIQWFVQKPAEEREVLLAFSEYLSRYRILIHYNGQSFDLPYLQARCTYWDIPDPFADGRIQSVDLYRSLRPLKQNLHLTSMKQKDLEELLHFPRKDLMSGKDLIRVYHQYLERAGEQELHLLLLHNHDDLTGMLTIYHFHRFLTSLQSVQRIPEIRLQNDILILQTQTDSICPADLLLETDKVSLDIRNSCVTITVQGIRGCLRHYYSNYRDYYYLPLEDTAIHKSVGIYVDPSCREKARADTCYTKKDGLFFFQPSSVFSPDFRTESRKGLSYFDSEQLTADPAPLSDYWSALIRHLLKL